jgi:hypothetical protein
MSCNKPPKTYAEQLVIFKKRIQLPHTSPPALIPNLNPTAPRLIYNTLAILTHMVGVIEPHANWPQRLTNHLVTLKPELLPQMGFPPDWQQRPFWQRLLSAKA